MADYPVFVQEGALTDDASRLIEFMEAQYTEADRTNDLVTLNHLSGPIAEYYTLVAKLGMKSPSAWFRDFPNSARNAYDLMKWVESEAQKTEQIAENTAKTNSIADEFQKFKEAMEKELADANARIAELTAKSAKKDAKPKDETPTEAETEA